jgi:hypothetical protein
MKLLTDMNLAPPWVETFSSVDIAALRQLEIELGNGALLIIDPSSTRLRVLPLQFDVAM